MESLMWIGLGGQAILCGLLSAVVATSKNRDAVVWFGVGLLLGIFGLIASSGMATAKPAGETDHPEQNYCSECDAPIEADATYCPKCGQKFD